VGRGGERRAIAIGNPGLPGRPYGTPTLWAAVQYLGPGESAPSHRHSQSAFRFVLEGTGVWTVVDGDAVAMHRGDLLLTPGWAWHGHHNIAAEPMLWLDGLDIPLVTALDAGFFEFGPEEIAGATPEECASEAVWGHPGLRPLGAPVSRTSPLLAYRWAHTDASLEAQLHLAAETGVAGLDPGHAGVRFVNPATGGDALATMRLEFHRFRPGKSSTTSRAVGSSIWQVFSGSGTVELGDETTSVGEGDLVAVPSWTPIRWSASMPF